MAEVCAYGGDAGEPIAGYIDFPVNDAVCCNFTRVTRVPVGSASNVMFTIKLSFGAFGIGRLMIGWRWGLTITGDRMLKIGEFNNSGQFIGQASSQIAVPGLVTDLDVWLRGRLTFASGLCEYWYSYDTTFQESDVTWIDLGLPQVGVTGVPNLADTQHFSLGSWAQPFNVYGIGAKVYAASEAIDGVTTLVMENTDIPAEPANSFSLSLGGTMNVTRSAAEPNTFLSPYSSSGSTYGMGHYGLCDQVQQRGCSPVRAGSIPISQQSPYADCEPVVCG